MGSPIITNNLISDPFLLLKIKILITLRLFTQKVCEGINLWLFG